MDVKDNKVVIDLPEDFDENQVEIIVMPFQQNSRDDFWAKVADTSLDNIWDNPADDEYEKLL